MASTIPAQVAQQLINTYMTEEGWEPGKTRATWLSLEDFATIQALINTSGGDGARIYFGKYPSNVDIPGTPDPAYKGMVTLVFIPTLATQDGLHQDLFPALPQSGAAQSNDQGFNHGELCPPNCTPPPPPSA